MYRKHNILVFFVFILISFSSCRDGIDNVVLAEYEALPIEHRDVNSFETDEPIGMYLLDEGNMGMNKACIDYVDFCNAYYVRSLYTARNPRVVKELGDVGNDIQIYGNRLYAVINCSHKVEVMDAQTCIRLGQIDIPNCRYIQFCKGKAYISSYVGPVSIDPNAQLGAIYEVDTATLNITRKVTIGYQPEELVIKDNYIYCVNSGGYLTPNYDSTLSIVEMTSFKQVAKIPVALNLHRIKQDKYGKLWISSRGNYSDVASCLCVATCLGKSYTDWMVTDTLPIPCSEMVICGDSLYYYATIWNARSEKNNVQYGIIDVRTKKIVSEHFITDGSENEISVPYGIAVNPYNKDIYITDAKNYVSSGMLHCYDNNGKKKWSVRTREIPAHMVFVYKNNILKYGGK